MTTVSPEKLDRCKRLVLAGHDITAAALKYGVHISLLAEPEPVEREKVTITPRADYSHLADCADEVYNHSNGATHWLLVEKQSILFRLPEDPYIWTNEYPDGDVLKEWKRVKSYVPDKVKYRGN